MLLVVMAVPLGATRGSARASANQNATPNYVYEIWYEVERNMSPQFDLYLTKVKDAARQIPDSPERWVDAHNESNRRLVSVLAGRLADYRSERYNESAIKAVFGEHAHEELAKMYADAQVSRKSYIRQYRTDLSLNRERYARDGLVATEYTLVTVEPGKEKQFERLWRTALGAYGKVASQTIFVGAVTLVGGGPQYVVTRPLDTPRDRESLPAPVHAVEMAFGSSEARTFASAWNQSVNKWDTLVLDKTGLDSGHARSELHRAR